MVCPGLGLMALRELANQREHWHVHRNHNRSDGYAKKSNQSRFNQSEQVGNGRVDFLFIEVRDLAEHRIERARLLADTHHLGDHMRKNLRRSQRLDETLALLDSRANVYDGIFDHRIAGGACSDVQRLQNRHTGRQQRGQCPRKARDRDLQQDRSDDRHLEQFRINSFSPLWSLAVEVYRHYDANDDHQRAQAAPARQKVADSNHDARWQGKGFAWSKQPKKDRLELWDNDDHDHRDSDDREQDYRGRIDHRRHHVPFQFHDLLDKR